MNAPAGWLETVVVVTSPVGLHARPATRLVQLVAGFDAEVTAANATTGAGPVSASSLTAVQSLGAMQGHQVTLRARGAQASEVIAAVQQLAARGFDDHQALVSAPVFVPLEAGFEPGVIRGLAGAPGVAVAQARRLRRTQGRPGAAPADPATEHQRLAAALDQARAELRVARDAVAAQAGEEHAQMMDTQAALLDDEAILHTARDAIAAGAEAGAAVRMAADRAAQGLATLDDPYLRARADDVRQIARLVAAHLAGAAGPPRIRGRGILIAPDLSPAETAALDLSMVDGIVTARGSPLSHTAILAKGLGIPAVVGAGDMALTIVEETLLLVDGDAGTVTIDPSPAAVAAARNRVVAAETAPDHALAVTPGGVPVMVTANITSVAEARTAVANGADGVGLFRTEFLFMNRSAAPTEDEQEAVYREVAEVLDGRPLVIRTVDAGGDKPLPYLTASDGARGIGLALRDPQILRTQLRAVLRVAADHPVAVMFPFVVDPAEVTAALAELDVARREVGLSPPLDVGAVIETLEAVQAAVEIAALVDFLSIGTNDLTAAALGVDRFGAATVAVGDSDVDRLVATVCAAAHAAGRPVTICGELAAIAEAIPTLVTLGARELSVAAPAIAAVKAVVAGRR